MSNAYHYQNTFDDPLAQEFRQILSLGFSPTDITGLQLWLDSAQPDAFTLDGQSHIEQWQDVSGNEHHAIQASISDRPEISSELQNGIAGVFFDYSANRPLLITDYIPGADDSLTIFLVVKRHDSTQAYSGGSVYKTILSSGRPDSSSIEVGKINIAENRDSGLVQTVSHKVNAYNSNAGFLLDDQAHLLTSQLNLQSDPLYLLARSDGVDKERDERASMDAATELLPIQIGGSSTTSTRRFWGTIYEVMLFDRALDEAEILQIETYLNSKWALNLAIS